MVSSAAFADVKAAKPMIRPAVATSQRRRLGGFAISLNVRVGMRCNLPDAGVRRCERPHGRLRLTESQELCHRVRTAQGADRVRECPVLRGTDVRWLPKI